MCARKTTRTPPICENQLRVSAAAYGLRSGLKINLTRRICPGWSRDLEDTARLEERGRSLGVQYRIILYLGGSRAQLAGKIRLGFSKQQMYEVTGNNLLRRAGLHAAACVLRRREILLQLRRMLLMLLARFRFLLLPQLRPRRRPTRYHQGRPTVAAES